MSFYYSVCPNLKDLTNHYSPAVDAQQFYASDLSRTLLLPYQLAIDLASQLGQDVLEKVYAIISHPLVSKLHENQTDWWVDIESAGHITVIKAKQLAWLLSSKIKSMTSFIDDAPVLVIALYQQSFKWDNEAILDFLHSYLPQLTIHFILANSEKHFFQAKWSDKLIKVKLNKAETAMQMSLLYSHQLNNQHPIINQISLNQELVFIETAVSDAVYYKSILENFLPLTQQQLPVLKKIKNDPVLLPTPKHIIGYAWLAAHVGASALGSDILNYYYQSQLDTTTKIQYLVNLQFIRLVSGYFNEAIAESYLNLHEYEGDIRDKLCYAKAYCGVLANQINISTEYFNLLAISADMPLVDLQSLYRMNIFALYQHRLGNTALSFKLEHLIENKINESTHSCTQIRYINSLNLARLYRFTDDFENSKMYYDRCYQTIAGLKSETDHVYVNVNYAMLYETSGDMEAAFIHWLRAAMHWLSLRYPEALGWRAVRAILKRHFMPNEKLNALEISHVFYAKLGELIKLLVIPVNENSFSQKEKYPIFTRLEYVTQQLDSACYYGCNREISFIATNNIFQEEALHATMELKHRVLSVLVYLNCIEEEFFSSSIIIDSDHNVEMPNSFYQIIQRCVLLNIQKIKYNLHCSELAASDAYAIGSAMTIKLSPAIETIINNEKNVYVIYKRFLKDALLDSKTSELIKCLQEKTVLYLDQTLSSYPLAKLKEMEQQKLICFDYDESKMASLLSLHVEKIGNAYEVSSVWD